MKIFQIHYKETTLFILIGVFTLGLVSGVLLMRASDNDASGPPTYVSGGASVICPVDSKVCPDGTAVGRIPPSCVFAECPTLFVGEGLPPSSSPSQTPPPIYPAVPPFSGGDGDSMIACTMDAKMCPDGTYVGRTGPNCEFSPCPEEPTQSENSSCKTSADCKAGYYCTDTSPVVRDGVENLRCWPLGMPTPIR